jgi:phosphate transport system substrate-binding protein
MVAAAMMLSATALTGCGPAQPTSTGSTTTSPTAGGSATSGSIDVGGSDTMVKMAQKWAADYMAKNPSTTITVKGGGSGTGIAAIINGTVTFANSSRDLKPEEIAQAKAKGEDLKPTEVAKDGIVIIVNKSNTVSALTTTQVGAIYRGEITNWKQVGGADKAIVLLSRDNTSGTYEFMKTAVIGSTKEFAKSTKLLPATQAIVDGVKASPDAIGYIGIGYLTPDVKEITLNGKVPNIADVQNGTYALSRGLFMISNGEPTGVNKAYLDWILGPDGQAVVKAEGFVPLQ